MMLLARISIGNKLKLKIVMKMKRSIVLTLFIVSLFSFTTRTYGQEDTCSFVKQVKLVLFFDYSSMLNIIQYFEQYHDLQDSEILSDNLEVIYSRIMKSACSIFIETDLEELQRLYSKHQVTDLEEFNSIMDELGDFENISIDHILSLFFKNDPEFQYIIGKMSLYLQSVIETVERFVIKEQLIVEGITPNSGIVDFYLGNYAESLSYFNMQLQIEQDTSISSLLFQGRNYRALGEIDSALLSLYAAGTYDPENYELYYEIASINYWVKEDDSTAYWFVKRALQLEPDDYFSNLLLGEIYFFRNENEAAKNVFTSLISKYQDQIDAYIKRGLINVNNEEFDIARADYNKAYNIDNNNIEAIIGKSRVHLGKYELDSSYAVLNRAIQLYPKDIEVNVLLGETYLLTENYDSCAICYGRVNEESLTFFTLNNIGFCKMKIEAFDDAIELFSRLIEEYPVNEYNQMVIAFAHNNLAYCYMKTGMYAESLKSIDTSLQLYPENPCAFINRIKVEELMGNEDDHCEDIKNTITMQFFEYCGEDADALIKNYCE